MSYTPGPWDFEPVEEQSVRPTVSNVGDYRVVKAGRGSRGYDLHGDDESDARLISAAPDLLEAIIKASKWLDMVDPSYFKGDEDFEFSAYRQELINAISKAKGEVK
jgi:hypothetical protein